MKQTPHMIVSGKSALSHAEAVRIFLGVLFYFAVAQISIPLHPIPMTFQTFGMLMLGLTYTRKEAFYTTSTWFLSGLFGLPVFAGFLSGPAVLWGPKGGFLLALMVTPVLMAWIRETFQLRHLVSFMLLAGGGTFLLFTSGFIWLRHLIGWEQAMTHGVVPFILWDSLKTVSAAFAAYTLTRKRP